MHAAGECACKRRPASLAPVEIKASQFHSSEQEFFPLNTATKSPSDELSRLILSRMKVHFLHWFSSTYVGPCTCSYPKWQSLRTRGAVKVLPSPSCRGNSDSLGLERPVHILLLQSWLLSFYISPTCANFLWIRNALLAIQMKITGQ